MSRRHDGGEAGISEAAQGYLLALRAMAGSGSAIMTAPLARRLGVSTQAASEMVSRLAHDGLVAVGSDRTLTLTPAGVSAADTVFRRHALLEWLLIRVIGLGWAESDEEAMRLQSAISPRVEAAIAELVGNPPTCPHGNPIDARSARTRPAGTRLSEIEGGTDVTIYRITEEAEEDAELLAWLESQGLMPGVPARVVEVSRGRDQLTIEGPRGRATLGLRPAGLIRVIAGTADPGLFHRVPARAHEAGPRVLGATM
jgi:DtxR family transcriptional regulator, Mn-dependent transcriptional regulator